MLTKWLIAFLKGIPLELSDDGTMNQEETFPTLIEFITKVPLYQEFDQEGCEKDAFYHLEYFKGTVDCYCVGCEAPSVFIVYEKEYRRKPEPCLNYFFEHHLFCIRDRDHQIVINFRIHDGTLMKVGQVPSIADLTEPGLRKYRKVLGGERYREMTRAVGLASHGVGIGAHVYLRRVFESLIEKYHEEARLHAASWDDDEFLKSRMDQKIQLLSKYLPYFLVENKSLYSILSKGVHELSEKECIEHFPVVKLGIEIILDEELDRILRKQKIDDSAKEITALHMKLKGKKS